MDWQKLGCTVTPNRQHTPGGAQEKSSKRQREMDVEPRGPFEAFSEVMAKSEQEIPRLTVAVCSLQQWKNRSKNY